MCQQSSTIMPAIWVWTERTTTSHCGTPRDKRTMNGWGRSATQTWVVLRLRMSCDDAHREFPKIMKLECCDKLRIWSYYLETFLLPRLWPRNQWYGWISGYWELIVTQIRLVTTTHQSGSGRKEFLYLPKYV